MNQAWPCSVCLRYSLPDPPSGCPPMTGYVSKRKAKSLAILMMLTWLLLSAYIVSQIESTVNRNPLIYLCFFWSTCFKNEKTNSNLARRREHFLARKRFFFSNPIWMLWQYSLLGTQVWGGQQEQSWPWGNRWNFGSMAKKLLTLALVGVSTSSSVPWTIPAIVHAGLAIGSSSVMLA